MSAAAHPAAPTQAPAPELVAKYLRAVGEPTRLRILQLLAGQELSVGELVERLGVAQPQVSNHLACLRFCGLVASRRQHRHVFYRLADPRIAHILELAEGLAAQSYEQVAACQRIDAGAS